MKRNLSAIVGVVVFGWMAIAAVCFIAANPGMLGAHVNPLAEWLGQPTVDPMLEHPFRIVDRIRASIGGRSFHGLPLEAFGALGFSIWALVVFVGTGLWTRRAIGLRTLPPLEALAVAGALGMGAWGLGVFALGVAGLLYPWVLVAVLIAATALSAPELFAWARRLLRDRPRGPSGAIEWIAAVLMVLALAVGLAYTLTPAIQSDGLRYHLAAPQVYLREHRIVYLPFNAFSNFPFLIEMLFTISLAVAGDIAAKLIHFQCFLFCGLFVGLLSLELLRGSRTEDEASAKADEERRGVCSPLLAPLVFFTTPVVLLTAAWEFIDLGTALFFVAMVFALVRWHRASGESEKKRWRLVAALFLGFLIGTKYTMLAMLVVVPAALLLELPSFAPTACWDFGYWLRSSLIVGFVAAAVASPWFIKNTVFTGNPVYPLAWGMFGGGEWSEANARFYLAKSGEKGYPPRHDANLGQTLRHVVATPWEATIHWRQDPQAGHPGYEDHFPGPVFLLWLPLLLRVLMDIKHRTPREGPFRLVVLFALAFGVLWYGTYQSNRLLIPALALLAVLVAYAIAVADRTARWISGLALAVLLLATLYNIEFSTEWVVRETRPRFAGEETKPSPPAYWLGFQPREAYLRQAFTPFGAFQLMPNHVQPGEKALFIGEHRTAYCPVEWRASDWFDTPVIAHYIRTTPDNDALLDRLLHEGIGWIFYNRMGWLRDKWMFYGTGNLSDKPAGLSARRLSVTEQQRLDELLPDQAGLVATPKTPVPKRAAPHPRLQPVFAQWEMYLYRIAPRR